MEKKYFLTALFQNKYGTALKYYNETGWHWMLPGDKPILFKNHDEARPTAMKLEVDVISRVNINEISIYPNIFEVKIPIEEYGSFKEKVRFTQVIHEKTEGRYAYFVTKTPCHEQSKLVDGLYPIEKKEDNWILGIIETSQEQFDPDTKANECYHKLEEAKAKMAVFGSEKIELQKIEGVLLFVKKIIKTPIPSTTDFDIEKLPEQLIDEAYSSLEEAKVLMASRGYEKSEIMKFESVALFVDKIRKPKGLSI